MALSYQNPEMAAGLTLREEQAASCILSETLSFWSYLAPAHRGTSQLGRFHVRRKRSLSLDGRKSVVKDEIRDFIFSGFALGNFSPQEYTVGPYA